MTRWGIWTLFVIAWTVALEAPVPIAEPQPDAITEMTFRRFFAKSVHVVVYAVFTVLSAWPRLPIRYRWLMMIFLMLHAIVTEVLQYLLHDWCGRGGNVWDVALDWVGILAGFLIAWKWWMRTD